MAILQMCIFACGLTMMVDLQKAKQEGIQHLDVCYKAVQQHKAHQLEVWNLCYQNLELDLPKGN